MRALYLASVYLHLLAAIAWIGGILFLMLVVVPWLRRTGRPEGRTFLRETGRRFRTIGWICFGVVLVTGTFNLHVRGVRLADLVRPAWLTSPLGHVVVAKLGVFALVLVVSALHDFLLGPRALALVERDPQAAERFRRRASWLGRVNALFALVLLYLGVVLVRG